MATKTSKKHQKDLDTNFSSKKKNAYDPSQDKLRVIQHNLVFVSGIPNDLASQELLSKDLYFGRYGKIKKVIVNNGLTCKKSLTSQAYITYQTQLQASIAVIALDGLTMEQKPLKASYGTTKYCTHFLKNFDCLNPDCFYLHHFEPSNQVPLKTDPKTAFTENNDHALNVVCQNLENIIKTIVENGQDEQQINDGFPTRMQMIDFLIDSKLVNCNKIDSMLQKYRNMSKQESQKGSKKSKSNSFSTVASPYKQQCQQNDDIVQKQQKNLALQKKDVKIVTKIPQKIGSQSEQKKVQHKIIEAQKIAEKLIIKQLCTNKKGKQNKSKLSFVQESTLKNEGQLHKIKSIIQKHLIASN